MPFSQWLREKRKAAGITQSQLAERVGVSVSYVSALERGESGATGKDRRPSVEIVDKLARALQLDRDEMRLKAGYAPDNAIISKEPQTLPELLEILSSMGITQINFFDADKLDSPEAVQNMLSAIRFAVELQLRREEDIQQLNDDSHPGRPSL